MMSLLHIEVARLLLFFSRFLAWCNKIIHFATRSHIGIRPSLITYYNFGGYFG